MKLIAALILISVIHQRCCKDLVENKTFVATKEWQKIPEGQGVPAGLHIRINLQTGKKEAKILEETEKIEDTEKLTSLSVTEEAAQQHKLNEEIGIDSSAAEKNENIQREHKSYEELKKIYEGSRKNHISDVDFIVQSIDLYNTTTSSDIKDSETRTKKQIQILESLSFLMSDFEKALLFVDQGGLEHVILPVLVNQTNSALKVQAMRIIGAMCQNNYRVQVQVYERNVASHLTQILMSSTKTEELSSALYAFSCLLRKFPQGQQRILSTSGTLALVSLLAKEYELKIKAKAATIISDIMVEKEIVLSKATDEPIPAAQYAELSFPEWLQANSYCETMDSLITANLYEFLEAADILEYFINSLENTRSLCSSLWSQSPQLRHILLTLKNRYSQSPDEYRLEISQMLVNLIEKLYPDPIVHHDEF